MGEVANAKLCILWEQELRAASKALAKLKDAPEEDYSRLAVEALNTCLVALHHIDDDAAVVLIAAATVKGLAEAARRSAPTGKPAQPPTHRAPK